MESISNIQELKDKKLAVGDNIKIDFDFYKFLQLQGLPILYYNGNFLQSNQRYSTGNRVVHRHLMNEYFNNIELHKNDIIKKKSIIDWQKTDELSRFLDFEQIGMVLQENIIIILYASDGLNVIDIVRKQFPNQIYIILQEQGELRRLAQRLNNKYKMYKLLRLN